MKRRRTKFSRKMKKGGDGTTRPAGVEAADRSTSAETTEIKHVRTCQKTPDANQRY